jgi:hypothetical protein
MRPARDERDFALEVQFHATESPTPRDCIEAAPPNQLAISADFGVATSLPVP